MRRLLKFKHSDEGVFVKYEHEDGKGDVVTLESKDKPRGELAAALQKMAEHLLAICELPPGMLDSITVRGVTVTWTNDVQGLVITGLRKLEGSNSPMVINTPHFTREPYNEDDTTDMNIFSFECAGDIDDLEKHVFAFVDGQRAQLELPFDGPQEKIAERPVGERPMSFEAFLRSNAEDPGDFTTLN